MQETPEKSVIKCLQPT